MSYSKGELRQHIENYRVGIELRELILATIEEFKHYKNIDKRFLDALRAKDCWIVKPPDWARYYVEIQYERNGAKAEIRLYRFDDGYSGCPDGWEGMAERIRKFYNYEDWIADTEGKLVTFDDELARLKEIRRQLAQEFNTFAVSSVMIKLDEVIFNAEKK